MTRSTRPLRAFAAALLATASSLAAAGMAQAAPAAPTDVVTYDAPGSESADWSTDNDLDATGYWTPERMRNAIPVDSDPEAAPDPALLQPPSGSSLLSAPVAPDSPPVDLTEPVEPASGDSPTMLLGNQVYVPITTGKVFYSVGSNDYVCSGSSINTPGKSMVATAGHCLHAGAGGTWHSRIAYAPAYSNGTTPYGLWHMKTGTAFNGWTDRSDARYDYGFFIVYPLNGRYLVDRVGGNGLSYNRGTTNKGVRIWGWPAAAPFDGSRPYHCDGDTFAYGTGGDMAMNCRMNGGSSGGPWMTNTSSATVGRVFGVTSRITTSGPARIISRPFDADVVRLYQSLE